VNKVSLGFVLLIAASPAAIATLSIDALVEQAARNELRAQAQQAGFIDPSIRVELRPHPGKLPSPCRRTVEIEALDTRFMTRMRFAAVCTDEPGWRSEYIVRGAIEADVVVAGSAINAGQPIAAEQLERARRDASGTAGSLSDIAAVVGKASQRPLNRGQLIDKRWLVEPIMVKRGASVNIVAHNVGVEVQVPAEAMEEGRRNDIVRVRNTLNGQIIRARVIGDNAVEPADSPSP
jgi:flagellar basal body P-ring formation protein FlgA